MNETEEELLEQTRKWREKLDERLEEKGDFEQRENVEAYRSDTDHFIEEEDYIRAWEAIVYAWGILETVERIKKKDVEGP
jgi:hypothetical protein